MGRMMRHGYLWVATEVKWPFAYVNTELTTITLLQLYILGLRKVVYYQCMHYMVTVHWKSAIHTLCVYIVLYVCMCVMCVGCDISVCARVHVCMCVCMCVCVCTCACVCARV